MSRRKSTKQPKERRIETKQPDGSILVEVTTDGEFAHRHKMRERKKKARDEKDPFYHNNGWFKPGHDPRRHTFTKEECQIGFAEAVNMLLYHYNIKKARTAARVLHSFKGRTGR